MCVGRRDADLVYLSLQEKECGLLPLTEVTEAVRLLWLPGRVSAVAFSVEGPGPDGVANRCCGGNKKHAFLRL